MPLLRLPIAISTRIHCQPDVKVSQNIEVINRLGLHARACASLVKTTAAFDAQVEVRTGDHVCNGKSIMGLMMLAATQGTHICVIADGDDAQAAIDEIKALFANRFGEDE